MNINNKQASTGLGKSEEWETTDLPNKKVIKYLSSTELKQTSWIHIFIPALALFIH